MKIDWYNVGYALLFALIALFLAAVSTLPVGATPLEPQVEFTDETKASVLKIFHAHYQTCIVATSEVVGDTEVGNRYHGLVTAYVFNRCLSHAYGALADQTQKVIDTEFTEL